MGETKVTWHSSVSCDKMYADMIADNKNDIDKEFGSTAWICPDVDYIALKNDPETFRAANGVSFNMIINTCA